MPMAKIVPMGESGVYYIHFLERTDPGFGGGRPGGVDPGWGIPEGGHPDHELPGGWPERPSHGLPGGGRPPHVGGGPARPPIFHPGHPDHGLPSGGGIPDNSLPSVPPPTLLPGYTLVMVRGPDGKWKYAAIKPGVAPPIVLPEPIPPGGAPDQGLPPQPPSPSQPIQPVPPPTAAPKA